METKKGAPDTLIVPAKIDITEDSQDSFILVDYKKFNHIVYLRNLIDCNVRIDPNQKILKLIISDSKDTIIQALDSIVIGSRCCEIMNCDNCILMFDCLDLRTLRFFNCTNCTIQLPHEEIHADYLKMFWTDCTGNKIATQHITPGTILSDHIQVLPLDIVSTFDVPSTSEPGQTLLIQLREDLSGLDAKVVIGEKIKSDLINEIKKSIDENKIHDAIPKAQLEKWYEEDISEYEDTDDVLIEKVKKIAEALRNAKHAVVYTGAGVSTSASILDYRGPTGMWTVLAQGKVPTSRKSLTEATPTYCHYALSELVRKNKIKYIVSTNVDGLHRRSGTPRDKMSELHGNIYREYCSQCGEDYFRKYRIYTPKNDWNHLTNHQCKTCGGALKDTHVAFTETVPRVQWNPAYDHAKKSTFGLVLGTSMNVQPAASLPQLALKNNGQFFIVNLQRTPYDDTATLKVYSKTDRFMSLLMQELGMTNFDMEYDFLNEIDSDSD